MSNSLCYTSFTSFKAPNKPGVVPVSNCPAQRVLLINPPTQNSRNGKFQSLEVQATSSNQENKVKSIVCSNCEGNGAIQCKQCKGNGVNSVDHFNGQFKAGGLCWLCRGKREILCGDCNGAGFVGGFMSTFDE